ncbi:SNW domain-containing protein 1, partial [Tanacetum coccineum]
VFVNMVALKEILPLAKLAATTFYHHSSDPWFKQRYSAPTSDEKAEFVKTNPIPVYNTLEWFKYMPSKPQDFGDGGAFSEIHYAQYPLDMGRKKDSNSGLKTLPVDIILKVLKDDEMDHEENNDKQKEIEETTEQTKSTLEKIYPMSILLPYIYFPM